MDQPAAPWRVLDTEADRAEGGPEPSRPRARPVARARRRGRQPRPLLACGGLRRCCRGRGAGGRRRWRAAVRGRVERRPSRQRGAGRSPSDRGARRRPGRRRSPGGRPSCRRVAGRRRDRRCRRLRTAGRRGPCRAGPEPRRDRSGRGPGRRAVAGRSGDGRRRSGSASGRCDRGAERRPVRPGRPQPGDRRGARRAARDRTGDRREDHRRARRAALRIGRRPAERGSSSARRRSTRSRTSSRSAEGCGEVVDDVERLAGDRGGRRQPRRARPRAGVARPARDRGRSWRVAGLRLRRGGPDGRGRAAALVPIAIGAIVDRAPPRDQQRIGGAARRSVRTGPGRGPASSRPSSAPRDGQQVATIRLAMTAAVRRGDAAPLPGHRARRPVRVDGAHRGAAGRPVRRVPRAGSASTARSARDRWRSSVAPTDPGAAAGAPPARRRARRWRRRSRSRRPASPPGSSSASATASTATSPPTSRRSARATSSRSPGWNIAIVAATVAALAGRLGAAPARRRPRRRDRRVRPVRRRVAVGRPGRRDGRRRPARPRDRPGGPSRGGARLGGRAPAPRRSRARPRRRVPAVDAGDRRDPGLGEPRSTERLGRLAGGRVPGWLAESLGVSLAAQAATCRSSSLTFGRLADRVAGRSTSRSSRSSRRRWPQRWWPSLGGAVARRSAVPAIVATLAGLPAWALLTAMCTVIRAAAGLPFASVTLRAAVDVHRGRGERGALILGAPALARWLARPAPNARVARASRGRRIVAPRRGRVGHSPGRRSLALAALIAATAALGLAFAHRADGTTRITVLDVGQGDSILVEGGRGGRMLDRRRAGSGPAAGRARPTAAAVGPPDRHPRPDPSARGPRRRACRCSSSGTGSGGSTRPGCAARVRATRHSPASSRRVGAPPDGDPRRPAPGSRSTTSASASSGRTRAGSRASRRTAVAGSTTCRSCSSARSPAGGSS